MRQHLHPLQGFLGVLQSHCLNLCGKRHDKSHQNRIGFKKQFIIIESIMRKGGVTH